jgi:hypothetical protein
LTIHCARLYFQAYLDYLKLTEALMSLGLEFLLRTMRLPRPKDKVYLIEDQVGGHLGFGNDRSFLTNALNCHESSRRRSTSEEARKLWDVKITSDGEENSPNAAWAWSVQVPEIVPTYRPVPNEEYFRSWGYVMWDSTRLEALKVMDIAASDYEAHGPKARHGPLLSDWDGPLSFAVSYGS